MIEDILEPVAVYRTALKATHARNTSEYFEDLVGKSGVDERANVKTVKELRTFEHQLSTESSSSSRWKVLRGTLIAAALICVVLWRTADEPLWLLGAFTAVGVVFAKLNALVRRIDDRMQELTQQRKQKLEEAWQQMAPLNRLYDWDIMAALVRRTVPRIELDPYFANARLSELRQGFGWDDQFNQGSSVVFAHSGVMNGNPFVLARTQNHWMGTKIYHGSLQISWIEQVRDSNGGWRAQTRSQTLRASVQHPFPEYGGRTIVIYGNEAAPGLTFTRSPSKLSGLQDGIINNWKKARAVKKFEAKSRNIETGSGFTIMANREFDALFGATDRDHEVQFRLLFTPLAQQEMVALLKDKEVGYGDDFEFAKLRMINLVEPAHMSTTDISADPATFHGYELQHARKVFNEYHNDFFKSFFFGLAPLLAIPLYQQHRSHADIYKDVYGRQSCFWEHESIANYFGEQRFQHPDCVTRNILKTHSRPEADGTQVVQVAAHGYRGIDRIDHVSAYGGDGRYHNVPVRWVEYVDVRKDSEMVVTENLAVSEEDGAANGIPSWQTHFQDRGVDPKNAILRRSIISALRPN